MTIFMKKISKKTQMNCSFCIALKTLKALKKLEKQSKTCSAREKIAQNIAFAVQSIKNLT